MCIAYFIIISATGFFYGAEHRSIVEFRYTPSSIDNAYPLQVYQSRLLEDNSSYHNVIVGSLHEVQWPEHSILVKDLTDKTIKPQVLDPNTVYRLQKNTGFLEPVTLPAKQENRVPEKNNIESLREISVDLFKNNFPLLCTSLLTCSYCVHTFFKLLGTPSGAPWYLGCHAATALVASRLYDLAENSRSSENVMLWVCLAAATGGMLKR